MNLFFIELDILIIISVIWALLLVVPEIMLKVMSRINCKNAIS